MSPRTGRPKSDNPKSYDIKIRIDEKMNFRLIEAAAKLNLSRTEIIRRSIDTFLSAIKK